MNKFKWMIALAVVFFVYAQSTTANFLSEEDKTVSVAEQIKPSIVKITADNNEATGFFISPDEIITNDHVTTGANLILLTTYKGYTCLGVIKRADKAADLALIHSYCDGSPLKLSESIKVGQSVLIVGDPEGQPYFLSKGIVSLLVDGYMLTDAFMDHGSSGSPIVNLTGEVVGVVKGKIPDTSVGAGIDVKRIKEFMKGD